MIKGMAEIHVAKSERMIFSLGSWNFSMIGGTVEQMPRFEN